ncbi:MAG: hypothetical protein QXR45_16515 [Candidatus Bathyarchaeia archaeon]
MIKEIAQPWIPILIVTFLAFCILNPPKTFYDFTFLFVFLSTIFLTIIFGFAFFTSLLHLIELKATNTFKSLGVKVKFLIFYVKLIGEYDNKQFDINIVNQPALPTPNTKVIYCLNAEFPFKITIRKGTFTRFGIDLKINDKRKYVVKVNNLAIAETYIKEKNVQEVLLDLANSLEKLEISKNCIKLYEITPFNVLLFKVHLTPTKIINTIEKLNCLAKVISEIIR